MVVDLNYPPQQKEGDFLFQWDKDHYHEYRYQGVPWLIRIQRWRDNPAVGFISFRDIDLDAEIPIPDNVRIRDEGLWRDVPRFQPYNYFRIGPFTNYTMLIQNCVPALVILKMNPPYFSVIKPQAGVIVYAWEKLMVSGVLKIQSQSFFAEVASGTCLNNFECKLYDWISGVWTETHFVFRGWCRGFTSFDSPKLFCVVAVFGALV
ncbi:hypothetical protein R1flu_001709 [Riccia fluitans]|uniref:Uncharacterized protein n=1 Tax=Riccia fluitans TaxID=41844 RepID=A0ABD1Y529_9MARC